MTTLTTSSTVSFGGALNMNSHNISGIAAIGASGDIQTTAGSLYATAGGVIVANVYWTGSAYSGGASPLGGGTLNAGGTIYLNGSAYTNP